MLERKTGNTFAPVSLHLKLNLPQPCEGHCVLCGMSCQPGQTPAQVLRLDITGTGDAVLCGRERTVWLSTDVERTVSLRPEDNTEDRHTGLMNALSSLKSLFCRSAVFFSI